MKISLSTIAHIVMSQYSQSDEVVRVPSEKSQRSPTVATTLRDKAEAKRLRKAKIRHDNDVWSRKSNPCLHTDVWRRRLAAGAIKSIDLHRRKHG